MAKAKSKKRTTTATKAARKNVAALVKAAEGKAAKNKKATSGGKATEAADRPHRRQWKELSLQQLQTLYNETVGRPTASDDRGYLIWKIREAEKGNVPIGPSQKRAMFDGPTTAVTFKFDDEFLDALDAAGKDDGFKTRLAYLRDNLRRGLEVRGRSDLAARVVG